MSMARAESIEQKKTKKGAEKPPPSAYRDYLDMDTDEEEFGRQETPEPSEELPPEPEKPVFTDEELETLVNYVQQLTVLPSNEEFHWFPECTEVIQEYFRSPANTVLTIFVEGTECKALMGFPLEAEYGLTYFVRSPWQIYTPSNFMSTVLFGNLNSNFENSILKFLENMYSPIAVHSNEWPKVTRDDVFSNLNQFLMHLTDATYGPMGLTILYVPREGVCNVKHSPPTSDKGYKGFIERLERVARNWIKQIRGALQGTNLPPRSNCRTIIDEIEFWNYRFENLSCLRQQLNSDCILATIRTLEESGSSSVKKFNPLCAEVDKMVEEASSNITYLNLFTECCYDFEVPDGIEEYSTKIFLLTRFIGIDSKFYNSVDKVNILCQALGTQVIWQCKKYVNLETILEGDANDGKKMLENSIKCCNEFLKNFDRLCQMDMHTQFPILSKINKESTFCQVNTFIQRCYDLITISDARIVYDSAEVKMIGGARGIDHEAQYEKVEYLFSEVLNDVKEIRDCILDVTNYIWLNRVEEFNRKIHDIDNMVKNLIQEIFKDVQNVEEGIEALYAMKRFVHRKSLEECINYYWTVVWKIFEYELENIDIKEEYSLYDTSMTRNAGLATLLRIKSEYLVSQLNMLIDASDWLGDNNAEKQIIQKYKKMYSALTTKEKSFFVLWEKSVQTDQECRNILSEPVLAYLDRPHEMFLTINLDETYLQNMREVIEWKYLKYDTKVMNSKFLAKWNSVKSRYVKVRYFCELHNSTIRRLSKKDKLLLENALNDVKNIILPTLPRSTWAVDSIDKFYAEWMKNILLLRDTITIVKTTDANIHKCLHNIASALLIKGNSNITYTVNELKEYLNSIKKENLSLMKESCESIISALYVLHRKAKYGEATPRFWTTYVLEIIEKFKKSLIENARASFSSALNFFCRDQTSHSEALLCVDVNLSNNKSMEFTPDLMEINVVLKMMIPLKNRELFQIDEFFRLLKFGGKYNENEDFIYLDDVVNNSKCKIEAEIASGVRELEEFEKSMPELNNISKVDEILRTLVEENTHNQRQILETGIKRCEETLEVLNHLNNYIRIGFMALNTTKLKTQGIIECENLKDRLFVDLSKFIASELTLERMPVQTDNVI